MSRAYIISGWEKEKLESETRSFQGFQGSKWLLLTQHAPQSCFQFYNISFPYDEEEKKSPLLKCECFWNNREEVWDIMLHMSSCGDIFIYLISSSDISFHLQANNL